MILIGTVPIFPISIVFLKTFEILGICFYADMHRKDNTANNSNNSQSNKKLRKYRNVFFFNKLPKYWFYHD